MYSTTFIYGRKSEQFPPSFNFVTRSVILENRVTVVLLFKAWVTMLTTPYFITLLLFKFRVTRITGPLF